MRAGWYAFSAFAVGLHVAFGQTSGAPSPPPSPPTPPPAPPPTPPATPTPPTTPTPPSSEEQKAKAQEALRNAILDFDLAGMEAAFTAGASASLASGGDLWTPLMITAMQQGSTDFSPVADKLLARNADITIKDTRGRTALWFACKYGQAKIAEALLKKTSKADIDTARDGDGVRTMQIALFEGHAKIVDLLMKAGSEDVNWAKEAWPGEQFGGEAMMKVLGLATTTTTTTTTKYTAPAPPSPRGVGDL
eukprot:TRINITY_DN15011_c5_g1_i1.p1 TRINITY_DN15011_c5_g1~~TRINITY_DN15011_c5_g1_i1.p1  ORF type:complete len:249 (+),score=70.88 TRINITY_DN15011_c5_g1_i1:92-838(+)